MTPDTEVAAAAAVADDAATTAGVRIRDISGHKDAHTVSVLADRVWGRTSDTLVAPELLVALADAGGQVTLAETSDGDPVGATVAFVGLDPTRQPWLHSHITGVLSEHAGRGVGRALKWHQRAWALERDITRVRWTFDPLVRSNAVVNLIRLGAQPTAYVRDRYGRLDVGAGTALPTDRLVVQWDLLSPRVQAAAAGRTAEPNIDALVHTGAAPLLRVGENGRPRLTSTDAPRRLVQVPSDIQQLRTEDPDAAAEWGSAIRVALGGRLDAGDRLSGFTRDGWYVLTAHRDIAELARSSRS